MRGIRAASIFPAEDGHHFAEGLVGAQSAGKAIGGDDRGGEDVGAPLVVAPDFRRRQFDAIHERKRGRRRTCRGAYQQNMWTRDLGQTLDEFLLREHWLRGILSAISGEPIASERATAALRRKSTIRPKHNLTTGLTLRCFQSS